MAVGAGDDLDIGTQTTFGGGTTNNLIGDIDGSDPLVSETAATASDILAGASSLIPGCRGRGLLVSPPVIETCS